MSDRPRTESLSHTGRPNHWAAETAQWAVVVVVSGWLTAAGPFPRLVTSGGDWHRLSPGLEVSERALADSESAGPVRVVVVRVDPARYDFSLEAAISPGGTTPEWTIDRAPASASIAVNAGQFVGAAPWGWIVHRGREARPPGKGPLSSTLVFGRDGITRLVDADGLAALRDSGIADEAIQSYPTLLRGAGEVPPALLHRGHGVDLAHRDSRLAVGLLPDRKLVIALTRYDRFGGALSSVPLGPTVPEMAFLMRRLGCLRAVSLDGGLSSQLLLRDSTGHEHAWRGWRAVPIGLVASSRQLSAAAFLGPRR